MATLKSKRQKKAEIEELTAEVEQSTPEVVEETPTESPYLNEAEQEALTVQNEKEQDSQKVSIAKLEKAVEVAIDNFNLCGRGFLVNGFVDKGSKCQLSMSNGDFEIVITIKDAEKFGIN